MFTGIITTTTEVVTQKPHNDGLALVFDKPNDWTDLQPGESIATNGVCLTVTDISKDSYSCDLIPETLAISTFGEHVPAKVNLERAMKLGERLSGHIVQGHVDSVGQVSKVTKEHGHRVTFKYDPKHSKYVVYKGTIIIDGVALTIAEADEASFSAALIPYTLQHTTLGDLTPGDTVNLEFDIFGKYIVKAQEKTHATS